MKKFLVFVIIILALASCEDSEVAKGRRIYKKYFKEVLKDPSSFVVYKEDFKKDGSSIVEWTIEYGAKNSFGGMVRKTVEFKTVNNAIYVEGSCYRLESGDIVKSY